MGNIAQVIVTEGDGKVRVDFGEDPATCDHFAPPGVDAIPMAGDYAIAVGGSGTGDSSITGYADGVEKKSAPGEHRIYSRNLLTGEPTAEVYLLGDGSIEVTSLAPGGAKVVITPSGAVEITGDVSISGSVSVGLGSSDVATAPKTEALFTAIISAVQAAPVTPGDGGASFKASLVAALSALIVDCKSTNIKSD